MIAIFTTEQEAVEFSENIHEFLTKNRPKYNATHWSDENKSDNEEKWMVKIPKDYEKWNEKLDIKDKVKVDKLPDNWKITKEWK